MILGCIYLGIVIASAKTLRHSICPPFKRNEQVKILFMLFGEYTSHMSNKVNCCGRNSLHNIYINVFQNSHRHKYTYTHATYIFFVLVTHFTSPKPRNENTHEKQLKTF